MKFDTAEALQGVREIWAPSSTNGCPTLCWRWRQREGWPAGSGAAPRSRSIAAAQLARPHEPGERYAMTWLKLIPAVILLAMWSGIGCAFLRRRKIERELVADDAVPAPAPLALLYVVLWALWSGSAG